MSDQIVRPEEPLLPEAAVNARAADLSARNVPAVVLERGTLNRLEPGLKIEEMFRQHNAAAAGLNLHVVYAPSAAPDGRVRVYALLSTRPSLSPEEIRSTIERDDPGAVYQPVQ